MKDTGRRAGGGTLKEDMPEELAEAWAAYVIGMRREFEVDIRLLSIQNEPDLTYYYPTCGFTPQLYARTVRAVQARLDRENLRVRVLGPDVCRIYNLPRYLEQMEREGYDMGDAHLDAHLAVSRRGEALGDVIKGRARKPLLTHLYDLAIPYGDVAQDAKRWREARKLARRSGRALWFTETANYVSYGVEEGSFEEAIIWARKIHHALADGDCEVVCYWSLFFDKIGEALVYCPQNGSNEYAITPKFYTSMNYFRFVRPGMTRVRAASSDPDLLVTAYAGGDSRVVVIVNWAQAARSVRLSAPVVEHDDETWQRYETTSARDCERVRPAVGTGAARLNSPSSPIRIPARSVTTLVRALEVRTSDPPSAE
jgi:O-glycosyl hydrolase